MIWAVTEKGKRMPVDAEPVEDGNVELHYYLEDAPPTAVYVSNQQLSMGDVPRYVSHFATCPESKEWRKHG